MTRATSAFRRTPCRHRSRRGYETAATTSWTRRGRGSRALAPRGDALAGARVCRRRRRWRRCSAARRARRSRSSCATPDPEASAARRVRPVGTARPRRSRRWRLRCCVAARRSRRSGPTSPRWAPSGPRARVLHGRGAARETGARARTCVCARLTTARRLLRARHRAPRGAGGRERRTERRRTRRARRRSATRHATRRVTRLRRMPTRHPNRVASRARRADPFRGA